MRTNQRSITSPVVKWNRCAGQETFCVYILQKAQCTHTYSVRGPMAYLTSFFCCISLWKNVSFMVVVYTSLNVCYKYLQNFSYFQGLCFVQINFIFFSHDLGSRVKGQCSWLFLDQLNLLVMKLHVFITIAWNDIFVAQWSYKQIHRSGYASMLFTCTVRKPDTNRVFTNQWSVTHEYI